MRILVTGFDPFGQENVNPAWEAVRLLPGVVSGAEILKLEIPTVFGTCDQVVREAVLKGRPDAVLSIGQAGGRSDISVEAVAVNIMDAEVPDNEGNQPRDQRIRDEGDAAYFATVAVKPMVDRIRARGVPAHVSYTAGTYVCNYVMYCVLHMAAEEFPGLRAGFIHVPFAPAQAVGKSASTPTMSVETDAIAITAALEVVAADAGGQRL